MANMNLPINSPGNELHRLMGQLGYPERMGDLCGTALDKAIQKDPVLARNLRDIFSSIQGSQLERKLQQGRLSGSGFVPSPKDALPASLARFAGSYHQKEQIHSYAIGKNASAVTIGGKVVDIGPKTSPADFEKKLLTEPEFRKRIEDQLGGRIVLDGNADGKIRVAKRTLQPEAKPAHSHRTLKDLMRRMHDLWNGNGRSASHAAPIFPATVSRDHRAETAPIPSNAVVRDHRGGSSVVVRDHRTTAQPARTNPVLENLDNFVRVSSPQTHSAPSSNGGDLSSILHDPTLSFEEKLALFMFAFLEKKQKDLEKKMEDLDKDKKGGGFGLGTLAKAGGAIAGAVTGGGAGAIAGAKIGTEIAGIFEGGNEGEDKSNQIAMMKLNTEMQEMNQMFSLVDNMLKSMNDVVRQGPLAAIRG